MARPTWQHVLAAVDLTADSARVGQRAREIADRNDATLSLLHVVEYIPVDPAGEALLPPPIEVERDLVAGARRQLDALGETLRVPPERRLVKVGNIKGEIVRTASELGCDLVALGARERHGLAVLLGSTEKSVLVHASCDVLAVRIA
jgi:universal stress protein A